MDDDGRRRVRNADAYATNVTVNAAVSITIDSSVCPSAPIAAQ